jgi:hypothetical protein
VIQEQIIQAVRECLGQGIDEAWEQVRVQMGQLQKAAFAGGGRHRARDSEPCVDVLDGPQGLDATACSPASAPRQRAETTVVLAQHPHRAAGLGRDDTLQALAPRRLERRDGLRIFLWGGGAALSAGRGRACA